MQRPVIGRLAPSPTGLLHMGNLRSLAVAWLAARRVGGTICLRVEDLLPDMAAEIAPLLADLAWIGLTCDPTGDSALPWPLPPPRSLVPAGVWLQSQRHALYQQVVAALVASGRAYPCVCTRKDIELAALAPHATDVALAYPGTCRGRFATLWAAEAWERDQAKHAGRQPLGCAVRLIVPPGQFAFTDLCQGQQQVDVATTAGDIVIRRKDGGFAYMLAVVVDDLALGVTEVVRGDDLLEVTGQQLAVYRVLAELGAQRGQALDDLQPFWQRAATWLPPNHGHVALVVGDDGRRLAKRNQSLQLRALRRAGVTPSRVRGWVAHSLGLIGEDWVDMAEQLDLQRLPRHQVRFGDAELATLLQARPAA